MLLALDTATRQAGLALYDGEVVRAEVSWHSGLHHTEWMAPAIADALRRINASVADLSGLAVTTGPGSFTGLRVAISLAKGMAAARDLPLLGVATLDVTAYPHLEHGVAICAMLQAGRARHAYAFYDADTSRARPLSSVPAVADIAAISEAIRARAGDQPLRVVGELTPAERRHLAEHAGKNIDITLPALAARRPAALAELAWRRLVAGESDDLHTLEPSYLHLPAAGQK